MSVLVEHLLPGMRFVAPEWLWGVPAALVLAALLWLWAGHEFHRRLGLFASAQLRMPLRKGGVLLRKRLRFALVCLSLAALCVTMARPLGATRETVADRQGVNMLIALDGSRSMLAEDVGESKNRFTLAQSGIRSLLKNFGHDRAGVLLFAGAPTLVSPLTFDTISLELIVDGLSVELAGKGGSSLDAVIERAVTFFEKKPHASRVLVIFTDGEETVGDGVVAAQEAFQKHGVRIFTIGVGSVQGATIPRLARNLSRDLVRTGTVRDEDGAEVRSRLEAEVLQTVASVGGGTYLNLQDVNGDMTGFYEQSLRPLAAPMEEVPLQDLEECFHIPLLVALGLILLEMLHQRLKSGQVRRITVTPATRLGVSRNAIGKAAALVACLAMVLTAGLSSATGPQAQQLLTDGKYEQAFRQLQQALLAAPEDPLARYNYAVGAYAAKKYSVAIETFGKLVTSAEPEVAARSHMQLGNNYYRLGEQLHKSEPETTVVQWEKALAAYTQVAGLPAAAHNHAKVQRDLMALLLKLAGRREAAGDEAARVAAEQGVTAWSEALSYLDKAMKLPAEDALTKQVAATHRRVGGKIYSAYFDRAEDKLRRAGYQQHSAPELAVEQLESAIADYDQALAVRPADRAAENGKREAIRTLEPLLLKFADDLHEQGWQVSRTFVDDAIDLWKQAGANYDKVLQHNPESQPGQRGRERNNQALHDGYVRLGDQKQKRADEYAQAKEKDALLEEALEHYQAALNLQPANTATQEKLMKLGRRLAHRFVERGEAELASGRKLAQPKPPEAIVWLERSVQSFARALRFEQENAPARTGKKSAEDLLRQLRDLDAANQRKLLAENKTLQNVEEIQDPGKLALKLLDYDTDKLASKKQQNYTLPENRSIKDW